MLHLNQKIDRRISRETLETRQTKLIAQLTDYEKQAYEILFKLGIPTYVQHIVGFYICDFVGMDRLFVLEIDGIQHEQNSLYDERRDKFLLSAGFDTYRISNNEVNTKNISTIVRQSRVVGTQIVNQLLIDIERRCI